MKPMLPTVTVTPGIQSNYRITLTLSSEDKLAMRQKVLLEYQKEATKPGFRKGHVPLSMVEQMLNPGTIMMASLEEFVNTAINKAVTEHPDYKWIGQPYELDANHYEDEKTPSLTFSLDVYPEIVEKNQSRKKIKKKPYSAEVTSEEIDQTVNQLRSSYATFDDASVVQEGILIRAKVSYFHKKEQLGHSKNQYLGREDIEHNKTLVTSLLGKKVGDMITIDYKKVEDITVLKYASTEGDMPTDLSIEVLDLKTKVLPELTQEFIDKVFTKEDNITSVEVLMDRIKETLSTNKSRDALFTWINEYLTEADASFDIIIPQTLVDEEMKNRLEHLSKQLGGEKGLQNYLQRMGEEASKKYVEDIKQSGITSMRRFFVLKFITESLDLAIDRSQQHEEGTIEQMLYDKVVA